MEEMSPESMPFQRLKVAILPLGLPCSGLVTPKAEILNTSNSHKMSGYRLPRIIIKTADQRAEEMRGNH
jgi:hypothetical protein